MLTVVPSLNLKKKLKNLFCLPSYESHNAKSVIRRRVGEAETAWNLRDDRTKGNSQQADWSRVSSSCCSPSTDASLLVLKRLSYLTTIRQTDSKSVRGENNWTNQSHQRNVVIAVCRLLIKRQKTDKIWGGNLSNLTYVERWVNNFLRSVDEVLDEVSVDGS